MFTYPVHQAADILFCKGRLVPVGKDQLPHVEMTRLVARRFNERYGEVFPLPEAMMGEHSLLRGHAPCAVRAVCAARGARPSVSSAATRSLRFGGSSSVWPTFPGRTPSSTTVGPLG
ncbi:hypothetical protein [Nonomuraea deserti]|uniref:hypothetical protein n=1 Tax=Nonomuraea deserti TaxID=1848322 RepID=UPI00248256CB|nr:hypothetical protein [Nonomuraea deserti]